MKNSNNQIILTENFIINNYLKKLNFKKKESFNFENDGAYLNVSKNEKIVTSNDTIVEGVDFFTNILHGSCTLLFQSFSWFAKKN